MTTDSPIPEVGAVVQGRAIRFLEHGALLDIGNGLKGLLHDSHVSWQNKLAKANEFLKIGEELDVVVLEVKRSKRQRVFASVSWLQTQENPWETAEEKHPVGSRTKAIVIDFLPFGAIVEFPTGFRALVHDSEVSWTERKPKAKNFLRAGDEIEVFIQLLDKTKRRIHASYRRAIENPWATFLEKYPIGTVTTGQVVLAREYGAFVMLANGCTGLFHNSQFPPGVSAIGLGESVAIVVLSYDQEKQRIFFGHSSVQV
jgi:small subunit ribosomal protein S1